MSDAAFTLEQFQQTINADLANVFGNFVNRITRFAASKFDSQVPDGGKPGENEAKLAKEFAERLRRDLPKQIELKPGVRHELQWSGGLSTFHDNDVRPDDPLRRADQALLRAKEAGRNRTAIYIDPARIKFKLIEQRDRLR